jgi:hypothetical protein
MSIDEIAVLHIELDEIEPAIWRRVAVRASSSLLGLRRILQATMGWLDCHLWEFEIGSVIYGIPDPDGIDWGREVRPARAPKRLRGAALRQTGPKTPQAASMRAPSASRRGLPRRK